MRVVAAEVGHHGAERVDTADKVLFLGSLMGMESNLVRETWLFRLFKGRLTGVRTIKLACID